MKKLSFLFLLASVLLFTQCTKDDASLEPAPPKPYSKPLVVDHVLPSGQIYTRTVYTYNAKGLETGIKSGSYERKNYKYEGKKLSYTDVAYNIDNGDVWSQTECTILFSDTRYTLPLNKEQITTYKNGTRMREVYVYNTQGLETSYKQNVNDVLDSERIDYKYEGQKSSFTEVWYTENGERRRVMKYVATYEDTEYKRPLVVKIVYSFPDEGFYHNRFVYTYNAQGLVTSYKGYEEDEGREEEEKLVDEYKDYTYGDKKSSYTKLIYGGGLNLREFKVNTTYLY